MNSDISISDYLQITTISFNWAESYDTKDWSRLQTCMAPSITLDMSSLGGTPLENLTPEAYAASISSEWIGDNRLKTQHLLGAAAWEVLSDGSVHVSYQIRALHQRYRDESLKEVLGKGTGIGLTEHWYRKVKGTWKIEKIRPTLRWVEDDLFGTLAAPEKGDGKGGNHAKGDGPVTSS